MENIVDLFESRERKTKQSKNTIAINEFYCDTWGCSKKFEIASLFAKAEHF